MTLRIVHETPLFDNQILTEEINVVSPAAPEPVSAVAIACFAILAIGLLGLRASETLPAVLDSVGAVSIARSDSCTFFHSTGAGKCSPAVRNRSSGLVNKTANGKIIV